MSSGRILVAFERSVAVIRLVGDVRVTLCTALDVFLENLFAEQNLSAVLVDASSAHCVDSTTLGLLAKLALYVQERYQIRPILYTTHPTVNRQFETMGFPAIYEIRNELPDQDNWPEPETTLSGEPGEDMQQTVLDAHKTLMSLNKRNEKEFSDLVAMLEKAAR